tara:strand:- start:3681 stop:4082 length:402 start_codon:yes stop_codon:yes gene_type:complete
LLRKSLFLPRKKLNYKPAYISAFFLSTVKHVTKNALIAYSFLKVIVCIMEGLDLKKLVSVWKEKFNSNIISINDLITKDIEGIALSCNQYLALKNYNKIKIEFLTGSNNRTDFTEKTFTTRLAANYISYKKFI